MKSEINFVVFGPIQAKQRPRFRNMRIKDKNGNERSVVKTYTPKKTKNFEELVAEAYKKAYPKIAFPEGPVELETFFFFKMPQSWSGKKKERMFNTPCLKKIDLDNCIKSVQDGLNGVAVTDDSQISDFGRVCKRWGNDEYTIIRLRKVEEGPT